MTGINQFLHEMTWNVTITIQLATLLQHYFSQDDTNKIVLINSSLLGVIEKTFRMKPNKIPPKETTFQCQYFELPSDQDYHLIASKPYIDNANIMHHIVVYGCGDEVGMRY